MLADGEPVVLDSGTTALEVARALTGRWVTVMPMSLHAAQVLAHIDGVRLLIPGGEVRPGELSLAGLFSWHVHDPARSGSRAEVKEVMERADSEIRYLDTTSLAGSAPHGAGGAR